MPKHLSSDQNPGWLGHIADSTIQLYRDYNKPMEGSLLSNQDFMECHWWVLITLATSRQPVFSLAFALLQCLSLALRCLASGTHESLPCVRSGRSTPIILIK